ncbi:serine/threonine-protein kinase fray2-like [Culicoides brevitarsis]|uniref:serine/threonine-protein kinase fray2-like n=1 Tax=Culicoides brevitarsis TaxID=469753 RepID=UPI00307BA6F1
MPRDKYSRSPSRSKKSKRSKSRDRDRDRHRDYDRDYDRRHKKSSKSSRSRDYSPDNRRKKDRYRRRSSSRSDSSSSRSPSHSSSRSSSRYKSSSRHEKHESRSRSESRSSPVVTAPPPPTIQCERFNFQDAVGVLDNNRETAADIDRNEFTPQSFTSTAKKLPEKVKIDLDMGTIELPPMPNQEEEEDTLFNPKFFGDEKERMQRWVRKMMLYRQPRMETN